MRHIAIFAATLVVLMALATPARAGMLEDCAQARDQDLRIGGCTAGIRSGEWQGKALSLAYRNRGIAYLKLGEYRRSIQDLDQALRLDPSVANAYENRGLAYAALGDHRRAIQNFDQALRLDPGNATLYFGRGRVYVKLGEYRRSIQDLDQALRLDPSNTFAYETRGFAYFSLGEPRRAIQDYDQALQLDPSNVFAYAGRGLAYSSLDDNARAIQDFDQALRLDPGNAAVYDLRAVLLENLNRSGETYRQPGSPSIPETSNRETVRAAQRMLAQLDLYEGAIDGIAGPKTRGAVRQFQEDWGHSVTGKIDQRLLGQLDVVAKIGAAIVEEDQASGSEPAAPQNPGELEIQSTGSGLFVTADGWLLTNRHVVEDCTGVDIVVAGTRLQTTRKIVSLSSDLALLKADYSPYRIAEFRSGKGIRPGSTVVVMGFPLAGILSPEINVTTGNVSALAGIAGDATILQHTAPVQPGNSGGPLLDDSGNVVGVVVSKANAMAFAKQTGDIPENIAFAIKSSIARDFLDAEGVNYATAASGTSEDIADLVVRARPYVALLLCMQ